MSRVSASGDSGGSLDVLAEEGRSSSSRCSRRTRRKRTDEEEEDNEKAMNVDMGEKAEEGL